MTGSGAQIRNYWCYCSLLLCYCEFRHCWWLCDHWSSRVYPGTVWWHQVRHYCKRISYRGWHYGSRKWHLISCKSSIEGSNWGGKCAWKLGGCCIWSWTASGSSSITRCSYSFLWSSTLRACLLYSRRSFAARFSSRSLYPLPSYLFSHRSSLFVPRLALPSQRLPLGLRLLAPAGVFPLREPPKAFDVKVRPIIHYCAFAPLTPIIRLVRLIRVCPLLPIDLANLVEWSIADPRSWHPAQGQVLIHALIALVLVHFGATWHFLQMKHRESCRH